MKKTILFTILALVLIQIVSAGVTSPLPSNIELVKGESGRFKFQVQALTNVNNIVCSYSFKKEPVFDVDFDDEETLVEAGTRKDIYGTVVASKNLELGKYSSEFCVSCSPESSLSGASVKIDTCGLELKVTVVDERSRDNLYVPEKKFELTIVHIAAIVILILIIFYIIKRKTKKTARSKRKKVKAAKKRKSKKK